MLDVIRKAKADAWAEGYAAGQDSLSGPDEWPDDSTRNPYRETTEAWPEYDR